MIDSIRDYVSALFRHIGRYLMLMIEAFRSPIYDGPTYRQNLARQMMRVGVESLPIVAVAAAFTGGVTTEQTIYQMRYPLIPESTVGAIVVPSIILEFGALITAFILAGRVSARIAAELGSMRTGGQIDALDVMGIRASGCLILPRVLVEATGAFSEARHVLGDSGTGVQRLVANLRSASADVEAFVEGEQSRLPEYARRRSADGGLRQPGHAGAGGAGRRADAPPHAPHGPVARTERGGSGGHFVGASRGPGHGGASPERSAPIPPRGHPGPSSQPPPEGRGGESGTLREPRSLLTSPAPKRNAVQWKNRAHGAKSSVSPTA